MSHYNKITFKNLLNTQKLWLLGMGMRLKPITKTHFFWVQLYG
jgi:hypothetical protein